MRGLAGKNALVTGGGAGIGRAICQRLGEEGAIVGVLDRDGPAARETADTIAAGDGQAVAYEADITDYDAIADAVSAFEAAAGPVDILVNNAGVDVAMPFLDTDTALWRRIVEINLFGPLNLHHVVVRGMAERRSGKVINISSDAARVGSSGESVYAACKGGIISFLQDAGAGTGPAQRAGELRLSRADRHQPVPDLRRRRRGRAETGGRPRARHPDAPAGPA